MARSLAHFFDDASFEFGGVHQVMAASEGGDHGPITIPDAHLLFSGAFSRSGSDLVIHGDHGDSVVVTGYFAGGETPDLRSPEGAILDAKVVQLLAGSANPGAYAQAGAAPASDQAAVGKVESATGSITVTHANGTVVPAKVGDLVYQGDVVQTGTDSAVGIGFTDGTAFSLSADSRMALNEFVFDPKGSANKAFISLVQGTFGFLAGKVAKTGDMKVDTPVATMGIRGTAVYSHINLVDGTTEYSVGVEEDGVTVGSFVLISKKDGSILDTVHDADITTILTPRGDDVDIAHVYKSSGDAQAAAALLRNAFSVHHLYDNNPIGTPHSTNGSHGSSDDPQFLFQPPLPLNFQQPLSPINGLVVPVGLSQPGNSGGPGNPSPPILIDLHQSPPPTPPASTPAPTLDVKISGTAQEGQVLAATSTVNGQPQTIGITYQWQFSYPGSDTWIDIAGATAATYKATENDEGRLLRVQVTYSAQGQTVVTDSAPTSAVIDENPTISVSESAGHQKNVDFVRVGFGRAVALNIVALDPDGGAVGALITGLPADVTLTDSNGDHLHIVNGSILLTASELVGLTLHTGQTDELIALTVTAENMAEGGSTTAPQQLVIKVGQHDPDRDHRLHHGFDQGHWFDHGHHFDNDHRFDRGHWFDPDHRFEQVRWFDHDHRSDRFDWSDPDHRSHQGRWFDPDHHADQFRWSDSEQHSDRDHGASLDHWSDHWNWIGHDDPHQNHDPLGGHDVGHNVGHGPTFDLVGGAIAGSSMFIDYGGELTGHGTVRDTVYNYGTIESKDGDLQIKGDVSGNGTLKIAGGSALQLDGSDTNNVTFLNTSGHAGALVLDDAFDFSGKVSGFAGHDSIDLKDMNVNGGHVSVTYSDGTLTVRDGAQTVNIAFNGNYSSNSFSFANDGHGGILITDRAASNDPGHWHGPGQSWAFGQSPHDSFSFHPGFGGRAFFGSGGNTDHPNNPDFSHVQALLQATDGGHDPAPNVGHDAGHGPGHSDGGVVVNVPINGLQSSDFISHHA